MNGEKMWDDGDVLSEIAIGVEIPRFLNEMNAKCDVIFCFLCFCQFFFAKMFFFAKEMFFV